jgi:hypothetical protein
MTVTLDGRSIPPWPALADVPARVALPGLTSELMGMAEHCHCPAERRVTQSRRRSRRK